ncbi:MAG TPA: tripartite tricarboxylate transporter substrate binding protein [Dongiaceae bacterium]|jgi:putative tricarboxylic transport membrane protein|nr:tripartite tricarboxylate transporter substrate binding protein [Dongiaceae bacterium]
MAWAQEAKEPPRVEFVVPNSPGGANDTIARILQHSLVSGKILTSPSVILNKPGGAGDVTLSYLTQKSNHPGEVAVVSVTQQLNYIVGTSEYKYTEYTPLAMLVEDYVGFAVKADSPLKSGQDIIDALKKDPKSLSFAITGFGGVNHIPVLELAHEIGVDGKQLKTPVFDSSGDSATALMGGHVDVVIGSAGNLAEHAKSGLIRILALSSPERLPGLPDVPTWKEQGVNVVIGSWRGLWGPKNMKPEEIAYWDAAIAKATRSDEWQQQLKNNMWGDAVKNAADTKKQLDDDEKTLVTLLSGLGLAKKTD